MKPEEKLRLKNLYKEMPQQQLMDMLSEDEKDFEEGVYELLVEEAKRRGLEGALEEIRKIKAEAEAQKGKKQYKFIRVFTTPKFSEITVIKSILDTQNIPYYIKGENFSTLYGTADGLSSMDVMVKEDCLEEARELLKEFIAPFH